MKLLMYSFITLLFITACSSENKNTGEVPAGGPCTFEDKKLPVAVVEIKASNNKDMYDVIFRRLADTADKNAATFSYYQVNGEFVPAEQLKKDSIAAGVVCTFVSRVAISGSCAGTEFISLERYGD